jgi:fructose/tagatose bisphosphate aldolase
MTLVHFNELMAEAERGQYAVGYFESWNLESLLAVADAAEAARSPVLLGFSGIYLPHPGRLTGEHLSVYSALGLETCRQLSVPACLVFNESPHMDWVLEALRLKFGLVMFTDERLDFGELADCVSRVVEKAHAACAAVEGEVTTLPGVGGELAGMPDDLRITDHRRAREFVERTGVDALAVNVGQAHLHGRSQVHLDLNKLEELKAVVGVPLVLHGATSIYPDDLVQAIRLGVHKINVGSALKRVYFEALRRACSEVGAAYNPYDVMGSGLADDVLTAARIALQKTVEDMMRLFGSARNMDN